MPQFVVISPTHIPGKKPEAWDRFRRGGYVAIGWVPVDLTGKPWEEVESIIRSYIRSYKYEKKREKKDMAEAIHAFKVFRDLQPGGYVAAKNVGHGLFGIGVVTSTQRFEHHKHDSGTPNEDEWYSQYVCVEWKRTAYAERDDIVHKGEKSWEPYGAAGKLLDEVPAYIRRALGEEVRGPAQNPPTDPRPVYVRPAWLEPLLGKIASLRKDANHLERAHESLVEDFLVALGYRQHEDIRFRKGRIEITVEVDGQPVLLFEVKREWDLDPTWIDVARQAYNYAAEQEIRHVGITNGDYYMLLDRHQGFSYKKNVLGKFTLSALQERDLELINRLRPDQFRASHPS